MSSTEYSSNIGDLRHGYSDNLLKLLRSENCKDLKKYGSFTKRGKFFFNKEFNRDTFNQLGLEIEDAISILKEPYEFEHISRAAKDKEIESLTQAKLTLCQCIKYNAATCSLNSNNLAAQGKYGDLTKGNYTKFEEDTPTEMSDEYDNPENEARFQAASQNLQQMVDKNSSKKWYNIFSRKNKVAPAGGKKRRRTMRKGRGKSTFPRSLRKGRAKHATRRR